MNKFSICLSFVFSFVMGAQAQQTGTEWKEKTEAGYTYKYVTNDPVEARFYTLKNGLTVILAPNHKEPRIQSFIAVKAGSKNDPSTNTGLAHYLEHMVFKGTDKYGTYNWAKEKPELDKIADLYETYNKTVDPEKRKEIYHLIDSVSNVASHFSIANEYDKMMGAIGAQGSNAFTSFEQTVYMEDIPASSMDQYLKIQAERFRKPILRIFHTELEAVYEEKNRSLDSDDNKVFELLFAELFKKHNYGLQTTIGTIEHLKNPSLVEIQKYYDTYYVPNNMAVIMSGDFEPNVLIKKIDEAFGYMQNKSVPKYVFENEDAIQEPILREVFGPSAESVTIGFRLPGNKDKDVLLADLVGKILTNGRAGLMDLNLVKQQKLLSAGASAYTIIDHGVLFMEGNASQGQSLEEVKNLMLGEIENLKNGNFDDDLITSIINNEKKRIIQNSTSYSAIASQLMDAFTAELDWKDQVAYVNDLSKISKAEIVAFANKYFKNNYVAIFKKQAEDPNQVKVEKPAITPVETNTDKQSDFVKMINEMPVTDIKPVWVDYSKAVKKSKLGPAEVLYVKNETNALFSLYYRFDMGTWNDKKLGLAAQYLQFLGTDKMSAEDISKAFYKIACSFRVSAGTEFTTVTIEGLQENFNQAVQLFEQLLAHCKPDEAALQALKARTLKSRADAKLSKSAIMNGLTQYARYGSDNPFNYGLSNAELEAISTNELIGILHSLNKQPHRIMYYGPLSVKQLKKTLKPLHSLPKKFMTPSAKKVFVPLQQSQNEVLFVDYDMVQAETRWVRNGELYDPAQEGVVQIFNNYFGGGMGAVVFQTIRESKALAYSTFAFYATPSKKEDPFYTMAYVGSQADKFDQATTAMNELLNDLPQIEANVDVARTGVKNDIATQRITEEAILFDYLAAEQKGLKYDIRKTIFESADHIGFKELNAFHQSHIAKKAYTYCVVASSDKLPAEKLQKLGSLKKIDLESLFGY